MHEQVDKISHVGQYVGHTGTLQVGLANGEAEGWHLLGKFPSTGVATPQQDQQVGCPKASLSRDFPLIYIYIFYFIYNYIYIYFSIYLYMPERTKNLQFFFSSLTDKDGKFTIGRRLPMGPVCFPYLQWLTPDLQPQGD